MSKITFGWSDPRSIYSPLEAKIVKSVEGLYVTPEMEQRLMNQLIDNMVLGPKLKPLASADVDPQAAFRFPKGLIK